MIDWASTVGQSPLRLLAVHAHPDDETLATGLALAHHHLAGDDVHVITCTAGEEGEVIPSALAHLEGSEDLGAHRCTELAAAMSALGVEHEFLGEYAGSGPRRWRDSGMVGSAAAAHAQAFTGAPVAELAQALRDRVLALKPDIVLTYDPQGGYGHPDHIRTHEVTVSALEGIPASERPRLFMVLTPKSWAQEDRDWLAHNVAADLGWTILNTEDDYAVSVVPDDEVEYQLVDPAAAHLQTEALRYHRTQVSVGAGFYALSNNIAARLGGREGYTEFDWHR
ncbi:PIG-L family deacetylase [Ornithinimicrobium sp. Arc0846-15]|nr:PIG-L family deacetylase [Ornithinimicrobium laminariae]